MTVRGAATLFCAAFPLWIAAVSGCSAPPPRVAAIPTGEWVGTGTYVDYEGYTATAPSAGKSRAKDGRYETTLSISEGNVAGQKALIVAIHSKRGKLFNVPGKETKLDFALAKLQTLKDGSVLYAVLRPEAGPGSVTSAVSVPTPCGPILHLDYSQPDRPISACFVDTVHFQRGRVLKTGTYAATESGDPGRKVMKVWWVEELRPARR